MSKFYAYVHDGQVHLSHFTALAQGDASGSLWGDVTCLISCTPGAAEKCIHRPLVRRESIVLSPSNGLCR